MEIEVVNELAPELAGTATGLANWCTTVSAPRQVMYGGQIGQAVVMASGMVRNNLTGDEREYGRYTFGQRVAKNISVIKIVDKLPPRIGGGFAENPLRSLVYREAETLRLGVMDIPLWHSRHQSYGFKYRHTKRYDELQQHDVLFEGEQLSISPNIKEGGVWGYGCEANVCFITTPETIEDGFGASDEFLARSKFSAVKSAVVSFGSRFVALNLYGDENNYKPFPDIGEKVKDHGIVMALRRIDDRLSIVELTPKALMQVDYEFDRRIYAHPGATIIDVDVLHNVANNKVRSLVGTAEQPKKYYQMVSNYYAKIIESYEEARREARRNRTELTLTPEFHALVVRAKERTQVNNTKLVYRNAELDDFRIELTYTYDVIPTIGFKYTGTNGDKGVIVKVIKKADMPRDQWGNVADLILDGDSTIKRMNPGRLFEQYTNITSRHVREFVLKLLDAGQRKEAWEYLYEYYSVVSSAMKKAVDSYLDEEAAKGPGRRESAIEHHLDCIYKDDIKLYIPIDLPEIGIDQIRNIKNSKFAPPVGPITYRGNSGKMRTTKLPVFIGSMYFMLLEKTGDDWSAVSSPRLQHFGIPAKLTKDAKLATPEHGQPVRILGEDEVRLVAAFCGGEIVAELLDQTNSPIKHRAIVTNIARAPRPMDIHDVAPLEGVPHGKNRAVEFVKHLVRCSGARFVWEHTRRRAV